MKLFEKEKNKVNLYKLGKIPWKETQLIYHALALLETEALCLVSPSSSYVCIGFHQDLEREVDLEFCRTNNIPVFRREVGGGAVFLDGNQLFFQLILKKDNPLVPKRIETFYKKFLQPVIDVHNRIGIPALYRPVNDIVVENRKISGTGAGEIGECIVFVGNLILDFDYGTMSRVLKIPDEKFRDKVKKSIEENLSTLRRETAERKLKLEDEENLNSLMAAAFEKLIGPLVPTTIDETLIQKMQELDSEMMANDWLYMKGKKVSGRVVKVRSGLEVIHRMHKSAGGLIRADFVINNGRFERLSVSGDFFCYPHNTLDRLIISLEGHPTNLLFKILNKFYSEQDFEIPGVTLDDWMQIFKI